MGTAEVCTMVRPVPVVVARFVAAEDRKGLVVRSEYPPPPLVSVLTARVRGCPRAFVKVL